MKKQKKEKSKARRVVCWVLAAVLLCGVVFMGYDVARNVAIKAIPDLPEGETREITEGGHHLVHELLLMLERPELQEKRGIVVDDEYIQNAIKPVQIMVDERFDCADFRMQSVLRLVYSHGDTLREISPTAWQTIENMFLGAKYWMSEPGEDSMCYWSENHQLLFAVAEYMAGQYWHDKVFTNDGSTGQERMERGRQRIKYWMQQRFEDGFSEFNSSVYYRFNAGPASNFIQFAASDDAEMVQAMKICLDLLFYDIALYTFDYGMTAPMGRATYGNMIGSDSLRSLTDLVYGLTEDADLNTDSQIVNVAAMLRARDAQGNPYYELPPVLKEIINDTSEKELRASSGLDTAELHSRYSISHSDEDMMRQLAMESFTNPEVIYNTITYLDKNNMLSSKFVNDFRLINLKALKLHPSTLEWVSRRFNPMPNGIAIQRANIYSYQTPLYSLASVQRYHPGSFGAQQYLNSLSFGGNSVVFTNHPAKLEEKSVTGTPGYWTGYGRAPHSVQDKNVMMLIYEIPKKHGFLELYDVPQFTRTYLPEIHFDEVIIDGDYAFARKGDAYLGLIGAGNLEYLPWSEKSANALKMGLEENPDKHFELVQRGNLQYWIYEVSDGSKESFNRFQERIKSNEVRFNSTSLRYTSNEKEYKTSFGGAFTIDGEEINLDYKRFDNPYSTAERYADEFIIEHNGKSLRLNFESLLREIG
ncbi:MAG: hypothetical protein FWG82_04860 [Oscillospiraceae bacterium]|nr:hypothetical protein [Oscillospiraceae bacterium]